MKDNGYKRTIMELYEKYYKNTISHKTVFANHNGTKIEVAGKKELLSELKKFKARYAFTLNSSDLAIYLKACQDDDRKIIDSMVDKGRGLYLKYNRG